MNFHIVRDIMIIKATEGVNFNCRNVQKIAVVIDADNTQISKLEDVFHEISTRGRIVVKRAYGNWHKPTLKNWGEIIKRLAIKAEQQFDYVSGKNATDMALVIDTIELLYTTFMMRLLLFQATVTILRWQ